MSKPATAPHLEPLGTPVGSHVAGPASSRAASHSCGQPLRGLREFAGNLASGSDADPTRGLRERELLPAGWEMTVPEGFATRRADADVILWRDSLTIWLSAHPRSVDGRELATPAAQVVGAAREVESEASGDLLRVAYRSKAAFDDDRAPAFHGEVIAPHSWLRMVAYFESEAHADFVRSLWRSARPVAST